MQRLQLTMNADIHCHVIWWKPKRSFLPRKWRRRTSSSTKYPKLSHLQALHFMYVSCLSQSAKYRSVQARSQEPFSRYSRLKSDLTSARSARALPSHPPPLPPGITKHYIRVPFRHILHIVRICLQSSLSEVVKLCYRAGNFDRR